MAAVLVSLLAAPALAADPPEDTAIALFSGGTVTSVVSTPTTIEADAPFLPDGVDVPAPGWEIFVEGSDATGNGVFGLFYAVAETVWLVAEGSATVVEPDPTTTTTSPPPDPITTTSTTVAEPEATTEVLAVVVEHTTLRHRFSARGQYAL